MIGRKRKLTVNQAHELREWHRMRSYAAKARQLGISKGTMFNYIRGLHKGNNEQSQ
jgi:hypothetical protein